MEKVIEQQDRQSFPTRLGSLSVRWKIRIAYLAGILLTSFLVILLVNMFQRKASIRNAYEKVYLVRTMKSKLAEAYFDRLLDRIRNFSTDPKILDIQAQLTESFLNIENDNYSTPGAESIDKIKSLLEGYYSTEIYPLLETRMERIPPGSLISDDHRQQIMQYLYIAGNTKPSGSKQMLTRAADGSAYSNLHSQVHLNMVKIAREAGISDMLLVDYNSGYVVYSMKKNLDFATSLYEGPFRNTALGIAFKAAIGLPSAGSFQITDESVYLPALLKPTLFISAPLFSGNEMKGAVIFTVEAASLDKLLNTQNDGLVDNSGMKSYFLGYDLLYRNNDPDLTAQRNRYILHLKRFANDGTTYRRADMLNTTAMVQKVDESAFADGVQGKEKLTGFRTATGHQVLCSYGPIHVPGLNWLIVSQIDKAGALKPVRKLTWFLCGIALILVFLVYLMVHFLSDHLAKRFAGIGDFLHALAKGERPAMLSGMNGDEIDRSVVAANMLTERISQASSFIDHLGKGNMDQEFTLLGEEDRLGLALNSLKGSLARNREEENVRKKEEEIRNWLTNGIALFNDILRTDNDNLEKLSQNIIRNIIQYLKANQGGIFLIDEDNGSKYLDLVAAYAFDRQKFMKKRIGIGEGLTGTCVQEKKTILLSKIPDNYIEITSGLGGARPGCLLIVPLKKEEEILGVMEIAAFQPFQPHEVEFVEKVAESIASALITVRLHLQTSLYLERFQQQAEEMKSQDEELRQNIEELRATHEQMERMKLEEDARNKQMMKEIEDNRNLLISLLNEIPEKIFLKDDKGRFVIANKPVADNYNRKVDELLGKSDFDFYPKEEAAEYFKIEQDIINSGKTQSFEEGDPTRYDKMIVRSIKKPFYIEHLGVTGLFGVQFDISDIKRKEFEAIKLAEEIKEKQQEIITASGELQKEKALLDALLNSVPEHVYFKDRESRFLRFSKSMLTLFGLKNPEELLGKSDFDFFSDEHARPAYEGEQEIIRTGKAIIDLEEKEVMEDGRISWVNTTKMPLMNNQGEIIGTFGISKNISGLKKLEFDAIQKANKLIENEANMLKFRKLLIDILDKIPAKIFLKDENGLFVVVNSAVASIYKKSPEQVIGTSDYDNHPDEDVDSWRAQELEIMKKGTTTYVHLEKIQGKQHYLDTTKMPFKLATTDKTGLLGIQFDISNLKLLEQKVADLTEEISALKKKSGRK
jgi:PAS domain S-box-containing protein